MAYKHVKRNSFLKPGICQLKPKQDTITNLPDWPKHDFMYYLEPLTWFMLKWLQFNPSLLLYHQCKCPQIEKGTLHLIIIEEYSFNFSDKVIDKIPGTPMGSLTTLWDSLPRTRRYTSIFQTETTKLIIQTENNPKVHKS